MESQALLWSEPDWTGHLDMYEENLDSWERRFFIIQGSFLYHFRNELDRSLPLGVIALEGCKVLEGNPMNSSRKYNFVVAAGPEYAALGKRDTYTLATTSADSMKRAIRKLREAADPHEVVLDYLDKTWTRAGDLRTALAKSPSDKKTIAAAQGPDAQALKTELVNTYVEMEKLLKEAESKGTEADNKEKEYWKAEVRRDILASKGDRGKKVSVLSKLQNETKMTRDLSQLLQKKANYLQGQGLEDLTEGARKSLHRMLRLAMEAIHERHAKIHAEAPRYSFPVDPRIYDRGQLFRTRMLRRPVPRGIPPPRFPHRSLSPSFYVRSSTISAPSTRASVAPSLLKPSASLISRPAQDPPSNKRSSKISFGSLKSILPSMFKPAKKPETLPPNDSPTPRKTPSIVSPQPKVLPSAFIRPVSTASRPLAAASQPLRGVFPKPSVLYQGSKPNVAPAFLSQSSLERSALPPSSVSSLSLSPRRSVSPSSSVSFTPRTFSPTSLRGKAPSVQPKPEPLKLFPPFEFKVPAVPSKLPNPGSTASSSTASGAVTPKLVGSSLQRRPSQFPVSQSPTPSPSPSPSPPKNMASPNSPPRTEASSPGSFSEQVTPPVRPQFQRPPTPYPQQGSPGTIQGPVPVNAPSQPAQRPFVPAHRPTSLPGSFTLEPSTERAYQRPQGVPLSPQYAAQQLLGPAQRPPVQTSLDVGPAQRPPVQTSPAQRPQIPSPAQRPLGPTQRPPAPSSPNQSPAAGSPSTAPPLAGPAAPVQRTQSPIPESGGLPFVPAQRPQSPPQQLQGGRPGSPLAPGLLQRPVSTPPAFQVRPSVQTRPEPPPPPPPSPPPFVPAQRPQSPPQQLQGGRPASPLAPGLLQRPVSTPPAFQVRPSVQTAAAVPPPVQAGASRPERPPASPPLPPPSFQVRPSVQAAASRPERPSSPPPPTLPSFQVSLPVQAAGSRPERPLPPTPLQRGPPFSRPSSQIGSAPSQSGDITRPLSPLPAAFQRLPPQVRPVPSQQLGETGRAPLPQFQRPRPLTPPPPPPSRPLVPAPVLPPAPQISSGRGPPPPPPLPPPPSILYSQRPRIDAPSLSAQDRVQALSQVPFVPRPGALLPFQPAPPPSPAQRAQVPPPPPPPPPLPPPPRPFPTLQRPRAAIAPPLTSQGPLTSAEPSRVLAVPSVQPAAAALHQAVQVPEFRPRPFFRPRGPTEANAPVPLRRTSSSPSLLPPGLTTPGPRQAPPPRAPLPNLPATMGLQITAHDRNAGVTVDQRSVELLNSVNFAALNLLVHVFTQVALYVQNNQQRPAIESSVKSRDASAEVSTSEPDRSGKIVSVDEVTQTRDLCDRRDSGNQTEEFEASDRLREPSSPARQQVFFTTTPESSTSVYEEYEQRRPRFQPGYLGNPVYFSPLPPIRRPRGDYRLPRIGRVVQEMQPSPPRRRRQWILPDRAQRDELDDDNAEIGLDGLDERRASPQRALSRRARRDEQDDYDTVVKKRRSPSPAASSRSAVSSRHTSASSTTDSASGSETTELPDISIDLTCTYEFDFSRGGS